MIATAQGDKADDEQKKTLSPCYSIKSLWGIPKQFQRALVNLNKYNINTKLGFKILNQAKLICS